MNNKFAIIINKKVTKRGGLGSKSEKGAALIYSIRCAIAHGGAKDIFYEQYDDADELVTAILSELEKSVFNLGKVTCLASDLSN